MSDNVIGKFLTKKRNECIVTSTQVLWYHSDGSTYQVFIRDIASITLTTKGIFSKDFIVNIWRIGATTASETYFATEADQRNMAAAIQTAMRMYGG